MQITDLAGQILTVTDLENALKQSEELKDWEHTDNIANLNAARKIYWTDIFNQLTRLKNKQALAGKGYLTAGKLPFLPRSKPYGTAASGMIEDGDN